MLALISFFYLDLQLSRMSLTVVLFLDCFTPRIGKLDGSIEVKWNDEETQPDEMYRII